MLGNAVLVAAVAGASIAAATLLYDRGLPNYLSRKAAHLGGGVGYLLATLLLTAPGAVALSAALTLILVGARLRYPRLLRGIGGSARPHAYAELSYPLAATVSLAIGWWWLKDPWLGLVPILFMAFGDAGTGVVRSLVYHREVKGLWGSAAMAALCLAIALLYTPYWIGAVGAVVATAAEKLSPIARGITDDNPILVGASLTTMTVLSRVYS